MTAWRIYLKQNAMTNARWYVMAGVELDELEGMMQDLNAISGQFYRQVSNRLIPEASNQMLLVADRRRVIPMAIVEAIEEIVELEVVIQ